MDSIWLPSWISVIANVPESFNGWGIKAAFYGPNTVVESSVAYLYVDDYITAFSSIIDTYKTAYETGNNNAEYAHEHGISELIAHSDGIGFALKDLDKNGTPELIIAGIDPDSLAHNTVYDIYTLEDNKPVNIGTASEKMRFFLRTDSTILYWDLHLKHPDYVVYALTNLMGNRLEPIESLFYGFPETGPADRFYYQAGSDSVPPSANSISISIEELSNRFLQWCSTEYIPPLTRIY